MNPKYPVYIISKGRHTTRLTSKALELINVPYKIVIEPQEYPMYSSVIDPQKILCLPFSNLVQGSIPARNWVWNHSRSNGDRRHWILDDNIRKFFRFNRNLKIPVACGSIFKAAEDFTDRYENVIISGMQYKMFAPRKSKCLPFIVNTRIYSCILLDNMCNYKWRGKYNEDTDLSIRILKDGYCSILFNAFMAEKMQTMTMQGGNSTLLYKQADNFDGRLAMAQSLKQQHTDIVKIAQRWGRWQHVVDYRQFKKNKLIKKKNLIIKKKIDNYGMVLKQI